MKHCFYRSGAGPLLAKPIGVVISSGFYRGIECKQMQCLLGSIFHSRDGQRELHTSTVSLGLGRDSASFPANSGPSFPVLKTRRIVGVDTLILRGLERGTFSVAREWTDWADPDPYSALGLPLAALTS